MHQHSGGLLLLWRFLLDCQQSEGGVAVNCDPVAYRCGSLRRNSMSIIPNNNAMHVDGSGTAVASPENVEPYCDSQIDRSASSTTNHLVSIPEIGEVTAAVLTAKIISIDRSC